MVDEILDLASDLQISLNLPHSVQSEIDHPSTPVDVKRRASALVFTVPVSPTAREMALHAKVRDVIRGNAASGKHDRDAYHLVEAAKYGGYFITRDMRLLGKQRELDEIPGMSLRVVTPTEFLEIYREYVAND